LADKTGIIRAVCISPERGTEKCEVSGANVVVGWGIEGDAHGGKWHRQISLLSAEKAEAFKRRGADIHFGSFGENIVVEGIDLSSLAVGTRLRIGTALVEITQIGKECHNHCEIYKRMGECIMPREGVFAQVISGGYIAGGDAVTVEEEVGSLTAAVVTLSDKGSKGEREDKSGPVAKSMLEEQGYSVIETMILPDDKELIKKALTDLADKMRVALVVTTGGTGFSERDVTPEATIEVCERLARGIPEAMRAYSMTITKRAMLSRGEAGIRGKTLIVNLPGSPKAVRESLQFVLPELKHGICVLRNIENECGGK
jgi:molybdenum cofactor synthesis domain-containing protein